MIPKKLGIIKTVYIPYGTRMEFCFLGNVELSGGALTVRLERLVMRLFNLISFKGG